MCRDGVWRERLRQAVVKAATNKVFVQWNRCHDARGRDELRGQQASAPPPADATWGRKVSAAVVERGGDSQKRESPEAYEPTHNTYRASGAEEWARKNGSGFWDGARERQQQPRRAARGAGRG